MLALAGATGIVIVLVAAAEARANPGDLDPSFSDDGKVIGHPGSGAYDVAVQPDGRILVAGGAGMRVSRYTADGTLDREFGSNGSVQASPAGDAGGYSIDVTTDGKILVAGPTTIVRYTADGRLDPEFGSGGIVTPALGGRFTDFAVSPDGHIVALGTVRKEDSDPATDDVEDDLLVARFTAAGSLDSSFSDDGLVVLDPGRFDFPGGVALRPDGAVLIAAELDDSYAAGSDNSGILRLTPQGGLDPSFSGDGIARLDLSMDDSARAVTIQPDGEVVIAGTTETHLSRSGFDYDFFVARFNVRGEIDASFGKGGFQTTGFKGATDFANGVMIQPDGKIVVTGTGGRGYEDFVASRYLPTGEIDRSFARHGRAITNFTAPESEDQPYGATIDPAGRLLMVGITDQPGTPAGNDGHDVAALARYRAEGGHNDFDADGARDREDVCPILPGRSRIGCPKYRPRVGIHYHYAIDDFAGGIDYDPAFECDLKVPIAVYKRRRGGDKVVGLTRGDDFRGDWELSAFARHGRYYAKAKRRVLRAYGICAPGRSDVIELRRSHG